MTNKVKTKVVDLHKACIGDLITFNDGRAASIYALSANGVNISLGYTVISTGTRHSYSFTPTGLFGGSESQADYPLHIKEMGMPVINKVNKPYPTSHHMEHTIQVGYAQGGAYNLNAVDKKYYPSVFFKVARETSPIYLGWEWENDTKNYQEVIKKAAANHRICYHVNFGTDGRPEMRSIPATLRGHKKVMDPNFFDIGLHEKFTFKKDSGTGIHVHIDKATGFGGDAERLKKFTAFIVNPVNAELVYSIAKRKYGVSGSACPSNNRLDLTFDMKTGLMSGCKTEVGTDLRLASDQGKGDAVNTNPNDGKTVEVRIFNTVNTKEAFYTQLEFCDALCRFVKTADYSNLYPKNFAMFVKRNVKLYPNLFNDAIIQAILNEIKKQREARLAKVGIKATKAKKRA